MPFRSLNDKNINSFVMVHYNLLDIIDAVSDFLLPVFICCVLPVCVVLIVYIYRNKALEKKTDVLKLAIEKGAMVDPKNLMDALADTGRRHKSIRRRLLNRLTAGCILFIVGVVAVICIMSIPIEDVDSVARAFFTTMLSMIGAIGLGFIVSFWVGKSMLKKEIEVEDLSLKHSNIKYAENAAARTGNAEAYNDSPASADVESASQLDGAGE